jgi:MFS family permease
VLGSAFAAGGTVDLDSGAVVDGEIRSIQGSFGGAPSVVVAHHRVPVTASRWHNIKTALASFFLLLVLGIGVLVFAQDQLDHVTATLSNRFGRAAWYGVVGEIALLPALLLIIVGLAITIVGILVIPFAAVAYIAMAIGAAVLGFMAVAQSTGSTVLRASSQASLTPRGAQLRALTTGISLFGVLWLISAIAGEESGFGVAIRVLAVIATLVAITVGFGAVLLWRFDVRRARRQAAQVLASPADEVVWQTPTPVTGVAAARRPTPAATSTPGGGQ